MKSKEKKLRLIEKIEISRNRNEKETFNTNHEEIEFNAAQPSIKYLLDPYANGFWEIRGKWNPLSHFSEYLLQHRDILGEIKEEQWEKSSIETIFRDLTEYKRMEAVVLTNRASTANYIFLSIISKKNDKEYKPTSSYFDWAKNLNHEEITAKFELAFKIFEEQIYYEGMEGSISPERGFCTKNGVVFFLEAPKVGKYLHAVSPCKEAVQAIADYYSAMGSIPNIVARRVFSPDEALFRPYFKTLSSVFSHVVLDDQIARSFSQSLDYYKENDFQHCISTLGLITEGYLHRIYSSILREENPNGLTLGQIIDRLHKKILEILHPPKTQQKNPDAVYDLINKLDANSQMEDLKPVLRELARIIKDNHSTTGKRIDEINKINTRCSPFPSQILENLNEILKWRNAASHNSRVPLAAHEADRTLYCLVRLITWWQEQLQNLDWSKTKIELLEELVSAAK